jgi:hypothetical protein
MFRTTKVFIIRKSVQAALRYFVMRISSLVANRMCLITDILSGTRLYFFSVFKVDESCTHCKLFSPVHLLTLSFICGPGSSVGIATDYELDGPGIESWWAARFFTQVQTGPGAHLAACTMGTRSFLGVKRPGRGADHPPLLAPRLRMSRAIPLLPL